MDKFEAEALLRKTLDLKHCPETELEYAEDMESILVETKTIRRLL